VKRQYSKGRFVVTEDSAAAIAAGPTSSLDCIPEQSPARVVKKGRFRIWTCLGCVNSVRTFSEEEELLMPAAAAALQNPVVECSTERERQATPESVSSWDCKPKALQAPALRALQERDQAGHRSSLESTSSFLSSTFSNRLAFCSDPTSGCADTPRSLVSDQGHHHHQQQQQQQQGAATPTAAAAAAAAGGCGSSSGSLTPPATQVRCYQRGRFAVEEAVHLCAPGLQVTRTMSCPLALQLPPPVVLQACSPLQVSTSAVLTSTAAGRGAAGMSPLCLMQRPTDAATAAAMVAADASPLAASSAAAAAAARVAMMSGADPCLQRQPVVSYYRRGRFLVQTVA
jgi:hypothetical protein